MERVLRLPAPCGALRDAMFSFAHAMLDRHGAFLPFGGYIAPPDQIVHVTFAHARAPPEKPALRDARAALLATLPSPNVILKRKD